MISEALERTGGNKNRAAELLGLNRTTLVEKLRRKRSAAMPGSSNGSGSTG
jgi:DNA-binding NtrC family response regulator